MAVMAGGALVEYHARACLLAKQEPQGPTLLKTRRSGPQGGACERSGLESSFKDRLATILDRRDLLQQRHSFVCRCLVLFAIELIHLSARMAGMFSRLDKFGLW